MFFAIRRFGLKGLVLLMLLALARCASAADAAVAGGDDAAADFDSRFAAAQPSGRSPSPSIGAPSAPADSPGMTTDSPAAESSEQAQDFLVEPPVEREEFTSPTAPRTAKAASAPPTSPYKILFYNNDFSYLDKPGATNEFLGDSLKRLRPNQCWLIDLGGEYRLRYHHEHNLRGSNLSGLDDDFLLHRTRLYTDVHYSDWFRFYGEALDAVSNYETFAPRTIEENRFDALNLFADLKLSADDQGELWGRAGRQELLYGEQRLVSPLDWSNTRRTFDGAKLFYKQENWTLDGFWTRPVPFGQHVNSDSNFDRWDESQEFMGLYSTHKLSADQTLELYFLRLAEYQGPNTTFGGANFFPDFDANTFGARWAAKHCQWLVEMEGGYQFGEFGPREQSAGFYTVGLGRELSTTGWQPKLWCYYDWASGDRDPTDGRHGTFNQLFPLGHKYLGFCDLVARQNIQDYNFLLTASPSKKLNLLAWYHIFELDSARDALYNAAGNPIRFDPTGGSGVDVGQELDLTAQIVLSPRSDVLFGYSHFWAGDFVDNTTAAGVDPDVDFFYTQLSIRF